MIEILVGMIASGKSTWALKLAKDGWVIVNDDAIVNAIHADDYTLYNEKLKPLYKSTESHIFHTAVSMGCNVAIDRGLSNTVRSRKRWIALANSLDVKIGARVFPLFSPGTHAERRAASDGRGRSFEYWLKVAQRHFKDFQIPTLEEGFDYIEEYQWT